MAASSMATPNIRSRKPITGLSRAIHDPRTRTGCLSPQAAVDRSPRSAWATRALTIGAAGLLAVALGRDSGPTRFTVTPVGFDGLSGWGDDHISRVIPVFLKSCSRLLARSDRAALDAVAMSADFGRVGEWRAVCEAAAALSTADDTAARRFFEASFVPLSIGDYGSIDGLFTGYYEIELNGSRKKHGRYQTPIYRKPADLGSGPYPTRAEIEDGAL